MATKSYFRNPLAEIVYLRTYARWMEDKQRRETWPETVERYIAFMRQQLKKKLSDREYQMVKAAILNQQVMPSMRLLQFAGKAALSNHICTYNCAYIVPTTLRDFSEIMYIAMCGVGIGFSVEERNIAKLPHIKSQKPGKIPTHLIADSREGWSEALTLGLNTWFQGKDINFDYSQLRPKGSRLKTMGGKSSGPKPLRALMQYARKLIVAHQGQQLNPLAVHDLICKIGEVVAYGGVRRSAMLSLSDIDNVSMRHAKEGNFYHRHPQRSIANNSAVYRAQPNDEVLLNEWTALVNNRTGERGLYNRAGLLTTLPARRVDYLKHAGLIKDATVVGQLGTNPCGEIILQNKQFCNLSEVVARPNDTEKTLLEKIKIATIIGSFQASLTDFPFLSPEWKQHCEQERLLGVSITGLWDCPLLQNANLLIKLKKKAIQVNRTYAKRFGIKQATSVTCIKPSGTVSQVVDSASGMHARFAKYYLRRIRIAANDALCKMLRQQGVPHAPEIGQSQKTATTWVFEFPVKAPTKAVVQTHLSALDQLEHWYLLKKHYTEHNPSVTILIEEHEWIDVLKWLKDHWDMLGGLAFLPRSHTVYELAPFEVISKQTYESRVKALKQLDCSKLKHLEAKDQTEILPSFACQGPHSPYD